ncbi:MAG: hypothetical protein V4482_06075, partial [Pseudomonadota bacterium]
QLEKIQSLSTHLFFIRAFKKTLREKQHCLMGFLKCFLKNGLNCSTINPVTGNPILFDLPYVQNHSEEIFDYLKRDPNFLTIRNANGLTVLDHMFTEYKKGRSPYGRYFVQTCNEFIKDQGISLESLISPDLYIFFNLQRGSIHGLIEDSYYINPFKDEKAQNWVRQMEHALESDNYFEIEKTLAESPAGLYEYYKIERPYDIAMTKHWQLVKERDNWFGSLYEARSKGLLSNETLNTIPLFCDVPEYYAELAPSFYQEFQTRVPVRAEQRKQIRETWEALLASALQSQSYMGLKQAMTNLPDPDLEITDFGAEIKQKVRIQSEEKRQRKVRHNVLRDQLEKEFRDSPETLISHVFDIDDIDFSLFSCHFFSSIFKDEYAPHVERFLNLIFKDVAIEKRAEAVLKPIGKNGCYESYEPFIMSIICRSQQKTIIEILKWAGCVDVLKQMTQNQLANVLCREYEKEDSYWIFNEAFDVFGIREPGRDFLKTALNYLPKDQIKKLAHHHIEILGELDETGWPLFYGLHENLVMELVTTNPALLSFETSAGLTLETLASGLSDEDGDYTITQRLLALKRDLQKRIGGI